MVEDWFRATDIDEVVTLIEEPHVHPFLCANSWLIRGARRNLLFDCGLGVASMRAFVVEHLGLAEPVAVLSHGHLDHMGSAHEFSQVWAHPAEQPWRPGQGSLVGTELMRILGMDDAAVASMPEIMVTAAPAADWLVKDYELRPVTPTRSLSDGERIDLGDLTLDVLHLPGHTPGSIALMVQETRMLLTGDVLYEGTLLDQLHGSNIPQYLESMSRLGELEPSLVLPGHGPVFDAERMAALAGRYLSSKALR
ncbi:MBL fold metallo-hydrolase [Micromonospora sp. NPDC048830]|uniref:MBL fold metallo-hydrolase n=1 Tax=Micromonospora sp. NPDC048830 TaxID=3364257 RepID=UPI0037177A02